MGSLAIENMILETKYYTESLEVLLRSSAWHLVLSKPHQNFIVRFGLGPMDSIDLFKARYLGSNRSTDAS